MCSIPDINDNWVKFAAGKDEDSNVLGDESGSAIYVNLLLLIQFLNLHDQYIVDSSYSIAALFISRFNRIFYN